MFRFLTSTAGVLVIVFAVGMFGAFQTLQKQRFKELYREQLDKVDALNEAIVLLQKVNEANKVLTEKQHEISKEIENAEGGDRPLPPGIAAAIARMRQ